MKGVYLWWSFVISFVCFKMCRILDRIHGYEPKDNFRNKRSQTMVASGQQVASQGQDLFYLGYSHSVM